MQITEDRENGLLRITGVTEDEKNLLSDVLTGLEEKTQLKYCGRSDDTSGGKFFKVHFESSSGAKLEISGTSESDKYSVNRIRNACFFGESSILTFLRQEEDVYVVTLGFCKWCGAPMIDHGRCEWGICFPCAEKKCEHTYVKGAIHGGGVDVGVGYFCEKCGLGKPRDPNEPQKTLKEHHRDVERELGIIVID